MKRREFIAGLGSATAWPMMVQAQQGDRVRRIGVLISGDENDPEGKRYNSAFTRALADLGWTDGRTMRMDVRWAAAGNPELYAKELIAQQPDVILVSGTPVTAALQRETRSIPVVFVNVADPVASGQVASFAHPGSNITGFTSVEFSIAGKWLTLLKGLVPELSTVMMLYDQANPIWESYLHTIELAASTIGVSIRAALVANIDQMERRIESFAYQRGAGMIVVPGGEMVNNREMIAALAQRHRVPAIYGYKVYATSGGLASYGSDTPDLYRRAAQYVDRILKGAKPVELPVQAPTKFEFVINLKAAKAIGLSVPNSLQLLADEVIE